MLLWLIVGRRLSIHGKCFRCIRKVPFENDLEFTYECAWDVMEKMNPNEVIELASETLDYIKKNYPYDYNGRLTDLVGDSYSRIYTFTMTHGGYLRNSYQHIPEVRGTIRVAAKRSMPAWGICSMFESKKVPMPQCWLDRTCEKR